MAQSHGESTRHFSRKQNIHSLRKLTLHLVSIWGVRFRSALKEARFVHVGYCLLMDQPLGEGLIYGLCILLRSIYMTSGYN